MKKGMKTLGVIILFVTILLSLTACNQETAEPKNATEEPEINNVTEPVIEEEEITIKNGQYNMEVTEEDISLVDEDIYIEIRDNQLTLVNGFAAMTQIGTFEIKDNKLVGTYHTIEYFDQSTAEMTTKSINDTLEFEIVNENTLKDNIGFALSLDKTLYKDKVYRFANEF